MIPSPQMAQIARSFDMKAMKLLLDQRGDDVQITGAVVKAAAGNGSSGMEVMKVILDRRGDDFQETVLVKSDIIRGKF
jgi:hypothetical protein